MRGTDFDAIAPLGYYDAPLFEGRQGGSEPPLTASDSETAAFPSSASQILTVEAGSFQHGRFTERARRTFRSTANYETSRHNSGIRSWK
jgi:hypothetical protein